MNARRSRAAARIIISASLVLCLMPAGVGPAAAGPGPGFSAAGIGTDGVVNVITSVTYSAGGARYIDGVVVNASGVTLSGVRLPLTFTGPDGLAAGESSKIEIDARLLAPGATATFHHKLGADVSAAWVPSVGAGGGWASTAEPRRLEIVSVTLEPAIGALQYAEEPPATPPARRWRVAVRNASTVPVSGVRVIGAEYQGLTAVGSALLGTVSSDGWDGETLAPGATASLLVDGLAAEDIDPATSVFPDFAADAVEQPRIALALSTKAPVYGAAVNYKIALRHADGSLVTGGRTLKLYWTVDGKEWSYIPSSTESGVVYGQFKPLRRTYVKAVFWGDDRYGMAKSAVFMVEPLTEVTVPNIAPERVTRKVAFGVRGLLKPDHSVGSHDVKLLCYRYERKAGGGSTWVLRKTAPTTASAYTGPWTRYSARLSLPNAGRWRVRAYHPADARTRADYSGYDYLTVK